MHKHGYNVHGSGVSNPDELIRHVRALKPAWMLVMDNDGLAERIKAASPFTNVILRHYVPDGAWTTHKEGAKAFLRWANATFSNWHSRFWIYVDNEAVNHKYYIELIKLNALQEFPFNLVICNYATGTPSHTDWETEDGLELMRLAAVHRDHIVIGTHYAYYMGDPTNGLQSDQLDRFKPETWLLRKDFNPSWSNWNVCRYDFMEKAFRAHYPDLPMFRVVDTEGGPESLNNPAAINRTGEIKGGWRNHVDYIFNTYKISVESALKMFTDYMLAIAPSYVEGQLLYCYGSNGDPRWVPYNLEPLGDFRRLMESGLPHVRLPQLKQETKPLMATYILVITSKSKTVNLRAGRGANYEILRPDLTTGIEVESTGAIVDGWFDVKLKSGVQGYVAYSVARLELPGAPLTAIELSEIRQMLDQWRKNGSVI